MKLERKQETKQKTEIKWNEINPSCILLILLLLLLMLLSLILVLGLHNNRAKNWDPSFNMSNRHVLMRWSNLKV